MSKTYPVIERTNDRITVLARSAEEAHAAATDELGAGCSIVSVDKVRSGGLGGFFATELVRLVATTTTAGRGAEPAPPARGPATFASAEELLQALPRTPEFASRLKEELAGLTAKGMAAADSQIPTAAERVALAAAVTRRAEVPAPAPARAPEPPLPELDELRWGADEEPDRLWRRPTRGGKGRRAAIDTSSVDLVGPDPGQPFLAAADPAGDEALLWAVAEEESAPAVPVRTEPPAPVRTEPPVPVAAQPEPVTVAPVEAPEESEALLSRMLEAEFDFEDRPVTRRASSIRNGRPLWLTDEPGPEPTEAEAEPEVAAVEPVAPLVAPTPVEVEAPTVDVVVAEPALVPPAPPTAPVAPMSPISAPLPVPFAPPLVGTSTWAAPTLRAFGIPDTVVERIAQQRPTDDTEWTVAFMLAVRHLCVELPEGPTVLTGPSGANLARQLGLVSLTGEELGESTCSVASPNATPIALRQSVAGRRVHLVVGGSWHHLVTVRPDVVSAATDFDLLEALRVAEAWGATLGWAPVGDRYVRIDPYLLAGRVRDLLPSPLELGSFADPTMLQPSV